MTIRHNRHHKPKHHKAFNHNPALNQRELQAFIVAYEHTHHETKKAIAKKRILYAIALMAIGYAVAATLKIEMAFKGVELILGAVIYFVFFGITE